MDLNLLRAPFLPEEIEWRLQSSGKKQDGTIWARAVAYVDNRAIMDRLDEVCGPENWKNEFRREAEGAVLCGLSIKIGGEWVTKWDGATETDIESVKGGLSNAMKRAAVQWGIGRYLYFLESSWAGVTKDGSFGARLKKEEGGEYFRWNPPTLPDWAVKGGAGRPPIVKLEKAAKSAQRDDSRHESPRTPLSTPKGISAGKVLMPDGHYADHPLSEIPDDTLKRAKAHYKKVGNDELVRAIDQVLTDRSLGEQPRPSSTQSTQPHRAARRTA
jgi:hypothetical protein